MDKTPPFAEQVTQALPALVERVRDGKIDGLLALDSSGEPLRFV